jgi:hypothetical protein
MELGSQYIVEFGALAGAKFTLKGKTTDQMEIRVDFVITPSGGVIPFSEINVVNKKGKVTISIDGVPESGTYQLYMRPEKADLANLKYKFKLKQPKGVTYSAEE